MEPFDLIHELRGKDQHTRSDVERLRELSERHSDCAELWDFLGDIQQICVDHEYAIEDSLTCYRKAIRCDPDYAPAHESLGYAYDTFFDDLANASKHFRMAIDAGVTDTARIGLARVIAQIGDSDAAIAQLDLCVDQNQDSVRELRREIRDGLWFDAPLEEA